MKFNIINGDKGENFNPTFDEHITDDQLEETIAHNSKNRPVLVHCSELMADKLKGKLICKFYQDSDILNVLSELEKQTNGSYPVLLATKEEFMRAIDYRAKTKGIDLIVAKSFSTNRQLQQGLGRVGRNNDPC